MTSEPTFERHYRLSELASLWRIGRETARKMIMDEPGVLRIKLGKKKSHVTYSVPQSVAERIHRRISA
jgi:hypothetical protein